MRGWFISPWIFMITTAAAVIVMWARQFTSDSRRAVLGDDQDPGRRLPSTAPP